MWACVLQDCEFRYKLPYKRTSLCRVIIFPLAGQRRSLTSAVSLALLLSQQWVSAVTMAPVWLLYCFCLFGFAAASHFRGGIIQWRPVDAAQFDGRVSPYVQYNFRIFVNLLMQHVAKESFSLIILTWFSVLPNCSVIFNFAWRRRPPSFPRLQQCSFDKVY